MVTEDARTRVINSLKNRIIKGEKFDYIPTDYGDHNLELLIVDRNDKEMETEEIKRIIENKNPFLYNRTHYKVEVKNVKDSITSHSDMRFNAVIKVKKCEE